MAWESLLYVTISILSPALVSLEHLSDCNEADTPRVLNPGQSMWDVPPNPRAFQWPGFTNTHFSHTLVPGQVEEAATRLRISRKAYDDGDMWLSASEEDAERERADAESQYMELEEEDGMMDVDDDDDSSLELWALTLEE